MVLIEFRNAEVRVHQTYQISLTRDALKDSLSAKVAANTTLEALNFLGHT